MTKRSIYCCGCGAYVDARLIAGVEAYPHRLDLSSLPYWKCDTCGNTVGCHHKTDDRTRPLGCIATPEIKRARQEIHAVIDPIWQTGRMKRERLYAMIAAATGLQKYHTSEIKTAEQARVVLAAARGIAGGLQ